MTVLINRIVCHCAGFVLEPIDPEDIPRANKLLYVTSIMMWVLCEIALAGICYMVYIM